MKFKKVMRYSSHERLFRLGRLTWNVGTVGDGVGCSHKVSVGFCPRLWHLETGFDGWRLDILFMHLSYRKSWGGIFA